MTQHDDLEALLARQAIADLVARYAWAVDRGRSGEVADLFTPDGTLDTGRQRWEGRAAVAAGLEATAARLAEASLAGRPRPSVRHHVSNLVVEPTTATEAEGRAYFLVVTDIGVDHWGTYRDRYAADGGMWRFAERIVRVTGATDVSLMAPGR